ncbi:MULTISPECIES: Tn7-like element transposition protein TnsE [Lysinibacillus]|uniref:Tn7-like element transposition protein TnsE n=1 Tax=Lysinibacillus xylanilyticus TaxID=582475 RepID=A0ABV3W534_9BACI
MSEQQVKLDNWPFKEGEQAQLIWISSPFRYEKKIMIYAYFRSKGRTEKLLVDWGTLPALAIQYYYVDGDIKKSIPPGETKEIEITIYPNKVNTHEREWRIYGTNDKDISRSFIVKHGNRSYTLPLIEVVRSILAPNRFLLYRLFESHSFPQYFIEKYEFNKIHLDFSSLYHRKYTQSTFLYQLVWLLTNQDLRNVFENVAYKFIDTGILNFHWSFRQSITMKAIVKPNANGGTVLRVMSVKNKIIPYSEITFQHPELGQSEKSNEPKKYTLRTKKNLNSQQDELLLDEEIEGTTDDFDIIEMDNQEHEYIKPPKITKVRKGANKKREFEDENTKKRFINDEGKRSTADVGGNQIKRGLEQQSLVDIKIDGELGEFIKVIEVLQDFPEVHSINIIQGSLKEFSSTKRFVYLSDGVTERKYVIAEVSLFTDKVVSIIEVERENKALSTLMILLNKSDDKNYYYKLILANLIDNSGTWNKHQLNFQRMLYITLRHARKNKEYQAIRYREKISNFA